MGVTEVETVVRARSEGEEVYNRHAAGMDKVKQSTDKASESQARFSLRSIAQFQALQATHSGLNNITGGMSRLGIANDAVTKGMETFNNVLSVGIGIVQLAAVARYALASAKWASAAGSIAEKGAETMGFAVPIILGSIAIGLAALIAMKAANKMAKGGEGIVTKPTLFMAGEAGPERFRFEPVRGSPYNVGGTAGGNTYNTNTDRSITIPITIYGESSDRQLNDLDWNIRKSLMHAGLL